MKKTIKNLIKIAEEHDWRVNRYGEDFELEIYSDAGQDFIISISGANADELIDALFEYTETFDISEEAYKWLDSSGHGMNGAPYEMIDVYKDMENCKELADELLNLWEQ